MAKNIYSLSIQDQTVIAIHLDYFKFLLLLIMLWWTSIFNYFLRLNSQKLNCSLCVVHIFKLNGIATEPRKKSAPLCVCTRMWWPDFLHSCRPYVLFPQTFAIPVDKTGSYCYFITCFYLLTSKTELCHMFFWPCLFLFLRTVNLYLCIFPLEYFFFS